MPFLPLFIVIGIFLAGSKILQQPNQRLEKRSTKRTSYGDFEDQSLSVALIDYISREANGRNNDDDYKGKSGSKSRKHKTQVKSKR